MVPMVLAFHNKQRRNYDFYLMILQVNLSEILKIIGETRSDYRVCQNGFAGSERPFFPLAAFGSIDDATNIAGFVVLARGEMSRSRADDRLL